MCEAPLHSGFFWAQWRKADPGTREGAESTPSDRWEPVEVFENTATPEGPDHLRVFVLGVEMTQSLENFAWGEEIKRPD